MYEPFDRYLITICPKCGGHARTMSFDFAHEGVATLSCPLCQHLFQYNEFDGMVIKLRLSPNRMRERARKERRKETTPP